MANTKKDPGSSSFCADKSSCCDEKQDVQPAAVAERSNSPDWIVGYAAASTTNVPVVSTQLTFQDTLGSWKARWSLKGRMNYKIIPGIYAVGNPDANSPVLVTANYKMSFDRLRRELGGLNLWILVLDTKGINVWCAAGKGTFGTAELIHRVTQTNLNAIVTHRTLILPQLGAPGVSGHEVEKNTGFKMVFGPVLARDIPEFLKRGMQVTAEMREVRFGLMDRLILTPIELVGTWKALLLGIVVLFIMQMISHHSTPVDQVVWQTLSGFMPFLGAVVAGAVFVPVLLPLIPGRALAWKGWILGLIWAGLYIGRLSPNLGWKQNIFYLLFLPPIASFLGMNFTGATTYTSLSGVVREMKIALPAQILSAGLGIIFLIGTWVLWR